jgi:hypothetical protein
VRDALGQLREIGQRVPFPVVAKRIRLPHQLDFAQFEWLADDWENVAAAQLATNFLPIAGADGDYLGVLLDPGLLARGQAPVVYYFHEHDPVYTWVFESCATGAATLRALADKPRVSQLPRGTEHPFVAEALGAVAEPSSTTSSSFAASHASAQRIWREHTR